MVLLVVVVVGGGVRRRESPHQSLSKLGELVNVALH